MRELMHYLNSAIAIFLLDLLRRCDEWNSIRRARSLRTRLAAHFRAVR